LSRSTAICRETATFWASSASEPLSLGSFLSTNGCDSFVPAILTLYVPGGPTTPMRPTVGASRPSSDTENHGEYSGLVRIFAAFVRSPRRFHHTRLMPAFLGALIVRTTAPDASEIVMDKLSCDTRVLSAFPL